MPLQKKPKLLILGDSNVAMFKTLAESDATPFSAVELDYWYVTGWKFNRIRVVEGIVSHPQHLGIRPPMEPCDLNKYDYLLVTGGRIKLIQVFEEIMTVVDTRGGGFSSAFLKESISTFLRGLPGTRRILDIRSAFKGQMMLVPTPLRGEGTDDSVGLSDAIDYERLYRSIWTIIIDFFAEYDIEISHIPFRLIVGGYLVKSRFNFSNTDPLHKNARFAEIILREGFSKQPVWSEFS